MQNIKAWLEIPFILTNLYQAYATKLKLTCLKHSVMMKSTHRLREFKCYWFKEDEWLPRTGMAVQFLRSPIHSLWSHFIRQVSDVVLQPNSAVSPLRSIQCGAPLSPDAVRSAHPLTACQTDKQEAQLSLG